MTVRRYLKEADTVGSAAVIDVVEADQTLVRLDGTLFCPSSVFRHADRGWLNDARVIDVVTHENDIVHVVSGVQSFRIGSDVTMTIDAAWRSLNSLYTYGGFAICHCLQQLIPAVRFVTFEFRPESPRIVFRCESKPDERVISNSLANVLRRGSFSIEDISFAAEIGSTQTRPRGAEATARYSYQGPKLTEVDIARACEVRLAKERGNYVLSYYASNN